MATTARAIIQPKFASTSMTAEYTAAEGRVIIDKFTATNVSAGAAQVTIHVVPVAGSVASSNQIVSQVIASGETASINGLMGHVLETQSSIRCTASASSALVLYASGRVIA